MAFSTIPDGIPSWSHWKSRIIRTRNNSLDFFVSLLSFSILFFSSSFFFFHTSLARFPTIITNNFHLMNFAQLKIVIVYRRQLRPIIDPYDTIYIRKNVVNIASFFRPLTCWLLIWTACRHKRNEINISISMIPSESIPPQFPITVLRKNN